MSAHSVLCSGGVSGGQGWRTGGGVRVWVLETRAMTGGLVARISYGLAYSAASVISDTNTNQTACCSFMHWKWTWTLIIHTSKFHYRRTINGLVLARWYIFFLYCQMCSYNYIFDKIKDFCQSVKCIHSGGVCSVKFAKLERSCIRPQWVHLPGNMFWLRKINKLLSTMPLVKQKKCILFNMSVRIGNIVDPC